MIKLIKERLAKVSKRGIYVQDIELVQTKFKPGDHFTYVVDPKNKKIVILQSNDETPNRVSKRKLSSGLKSVIDLRNKEALAALNGSDYWQIKIFNDQIIVEGYVEQEAKSNIVSKLRAKVKDVFGSKTSKVVDITDVLKLKRTSRIVLSKKELNRVVGDPFSYTDFVQSVTSTGHVVEISDRLQNLRVPLQLVSLFSGCGAMDLGFAEDFDIVFALEKDEEAAMTYRYNLGNHIVTADITKFDKTLLPKASVVMGGSPCQGLSNANRHSNFLDNPNNKLVREFIDSVKAIDAQVFVLENVPQILTAGNGKFKEEIYDALSDYEISSGVLSAADFGTAQDRKRAIFIGSKIGKIDLPEPQYSSKNYLTVREAFIGIHNELPNQLDYSIPKPDTELRMSYVPQGGNWESIPDHLKSSKMTSGKTHSVIYRRLEWDKVSFTLPNVRKSNITHPELNRSLSIRECARLFSIPDSFVFKGKLSSKQQQIANSVPVNLAKAISKKIRDAIMTFNIRSRSALSF